MAYCPLKVSKAQTSVSLDCHAPENTGHWTLVILRVTDTETCARWWPNGRQYFPSLIAI